MADRRIAQTSDVFDRYRKSDGDIPNLSVVHKFGRISGLTNALTPVCFGGFYRTPSSAQSLEIVSSSANDTVGGTGAWHVLVEGVKDNLIKDSEIVALNGTTPVALANKYWRIYRCYVVSSGTYATQTASSHAGNLTLRGAGGGSTWVIINGLPTFARAQSQIGAYSTAINQRAFISHIHINVDSKGVVNLLLFKRTNFNINTAPYSPIRLVQEYDGISGTADFQYDDPISGFPPLTDFGFLAQTQSAGDSADVSVDFTIEIEEIAQDVSSVATASMISSASMFATPTLIKPASADITSSADVAADGGLIFSASADIDAGAAMVGSGKIIIPASADIDAGATVTADGAVTTTFNASADISAGATVTADGSLIFPASADISAGATVTADGTVSSGISLPASTVFNLDAADINSYNNSTDLQLWKNTITSPADGSAQSAYNVYRGATASASTDDPTFNGTAGTSSAYWSTDGADLFYLVGSNTTFFNNLLRTDISNTWHMGLAFRTPSSLASPFALATNSSQTTTEHGFLLYQTGGGIQLWRRNASGATNIVQLIAASTLSVNTQYMLLFSYNSSTFAYDVYLNSRTSTNSGTGGSYTSTTNPTDKLCLLAQPTLFNANAPSGTRVYSLMMGNTGLNSTSVGDIYDYFNAQHGRTYA